MSDWLRYLFGLERGEIPVEGDTHWELTGLPQGTALFAAAVIVAAAVFFIALLYRRERRLLRSQRVTLAALRLLALALVLVVLLNPRIVTEIHFERQGKTVMLVDVSQSMGEKDRFQGTEAHGLASATGLALEPPPTRLELARAALARNDIVARLGEQNRVHLFAMAEHATRVSDLEELDGTALEGGETRLGDALHAATQDVGSDLLAGAVLVTDGRNNAGGAPIDLVEDLSRWGRVPVHAVAVGKSQVIKNYVVRDLGAPPVVEAGFPVQIEASVRLSGINSPVRVTLYRSERSERARTAIEERFIEPASLLLESQLKFIDTPPEKGTYRYTLSVQRHADESSHQDNVRSVTVVVADQRQRVLFVAGTPNWEYQHLREFFERDKGIQVSCWLMESNRQRQQDGDIVIRSLPTSSRELKPYDVVLLLDPDTGNLPADFLGALPEFVADQGGGLVFVAGETYTHAVGSAAAAAPLRKLLPVELSRRGPATGEVHSEPWRANLTAAGLTHPVCQLENEESRNRRLWEILPPLYFAFSAGDLKPAAYAILRDGGGGVLSALQQVGLGESLFLGTDDLWRWRASGLDIHERFWAGVLRHMAQGKKRAGMREITVETDRDRFTRGDQVQVVLHIRDANPEATHSPHQEVRVVPVSPLDLDESGSGESAARSAADTGPWPLRLYPTASDPARYVGYFRARWTGEFGVEFESKERTSFHVLPVSTEWENTSPNFDLLRELAAKTGGSFLELADVEALPDLIPKASVTEVVGRRASTIWDSSALMVLFCGLLILEWSLRKLWHLN